MDTAKESRDRRPVSTLRPGMIGKKQNQVFFFFFYKDADMSEEKHIEADRKRVRMVV